MAQTPSDRPIDTRQYRTSWRLTFRFDGRQVDLVRRERLQKVAPGTTPEPPTPGQNSGAWLELVDRSGRVLFHRLLRDPLRTRAEVHSPDGHITLHIREPESGEFSAIVPDLPDAAEVVLYASPTDHQRMHEPASALGRFPLRQDGPAGEPQAMEEGGSPGRPGGGGKPDDGRGNKGGTDAREDV